MACIALLAACPPAPKPPVAVTGVSLDKTTIAPAVGATEQLTATVAPTDSAEKGVSWSTSDAAVATVSSSGLVTAVGGGSATITVTTTDGGFKAACACSVPAPAAPVSGVSMNKAATTIDIGYTEQLVATVAPADAGNKNVTWSTDNDAVASVSATGLVTVPTSAADGKTATITATTAEGGFTATCVVTTEFWAVTGMSVDPAAVQVGVGNATQLAAVFTPAHATNKSVAWTSSNEAVATVGLSTGLVTGVATGTATITATSAEGSFADTCFVTVVVPVTGVSLDLGSANLEIGGTQQLTASVLPAEATDTSVTWSTSDATRATVSATGLVTGVSDGDVTITVRTNDGDFTATCLVTVLPQLYRTFNSIDCTNDAIYAVPATRRAVGSHSIVYVENAQLANVSEATAAAVCAEFDADIYGMMRTNFANESDVDGNGKVIFLLQDIIDGFSGGGYVAGFFYPVNQFDASDEPDSNEADMLFMDVNPAVVGSDGFYGTMAHEFQHLINFSNTYMEDEVEQTIWINEGLSSGAEFLYAGEQVASRITYFNNDPQGSILNGNNFFIWNGLMEQAFNDQLANYSTVYLFFQWLQLHASNGTGIYKDILQSDYRDYRAVTTAASARINSIYSSWETLLRTWMIANRVNRSTGDYGYLEEITVASPYYTNQGAFKWDYFSSGEGIISQTNGGTYTPPSGSGTNIRYAGFSSSGTVDTTGSAYAGTYALVFNTSTSQNANLRESGFIANTDDSVASLKGVKPLMSSTIQTGPYAIDVSFGPKGKLKASSHRLPGKDRGALAQPLIMKPVQ